MFGCPRNRVNFTHVLIDQGQMIPHKGRTRSGLALGQREHPVRDVDPSDIQSSFGQRQSYPPSTATEFEHRPARFTRKLLVKGNIAGDLRRFGSVERVISSDEERVGAFIKPAHGRPRSLLILT